MIGAIVGDVLGSVYEGAMVKTKQFELFRPQDRPTDDSVLTLAVARAILGAAGPAVPAPEDFGRHLRDFGGRYPRAGYGGSFLRWLQDASMGAYGSWGNGAAMRSSAVGWAYDDVDDVLLVAERTALPTHDHPEGVKGAQAVALAVFLARHGASREELRAELSRRFGYDLDRTVDEIRPGYQFEISCRRSVPEAIVAFLDSTDFEDAIRNAISLGGDADTQACIAGAVAEAFYGGVPESILAWVLPRLDGPQLRIAREFAGRYLAATGAAEAMDRLVGDRLPGGSNATDTFEQPHRRDPEYRIVLSGETWSRLAEYATRLEAHRDAPGRYLARELELVTRVPGDEDGSATREADRRPVTPELLLESLVNTKRPRIFAEREVAGDGSDWTALELGLLGDIGVVAPVTVYDDGRHRGPAVHEPPFPGTLLFVPGALLRADGGATPADWDEVVSDGSIDQEAYTRLYERRLLPSLAYVSARAVAAGRQVVVTTPGLGCGQFAGRFHGSMGAHLRDALRVLLEQHASELPGIRAVWYDPYDECENERNEVGAISCLVRPLLRSERERPQLCRPTDFEEPGDDYSNCDLASFVAWDHVSWPGNDFYAGGRRTDDGVKAAATDSMRVMTGFAGSYRRESCSYEPPADVATWEALVRANGLRIETRAVTVVVGGGEEAATTELEEIDDGTA